MKKLSLLIITFCLFLNTPNAFAKKIDLNSIVNESKLNDSATISVVVKNAHSGALEYGYNKDKLIHPASVLKLLTLPAILDTLTPEYKFQTKFATDSNKNLYIKLSGDPTFTSLQLKSALKSLPIKNLNNIYIDDKALDRFEWGTGWMWDDETNPRMSKISPYNLNQNVLTLNVTPTTPGQQAKITQVTNNTATIINYTKTGSQNNIQTFRQNSVSPNVIYIYGTVEKPEQIKVPIANPERFFITNVQTILKTPMPIQIGTYTSKPAENKVIESGITDLLPKILQESNTFYTETLFKTAGGKYAKGQGTFDNAIEMFNSYYKKLGLDTKKIIIADGSGFSRNNLFSADWITEALYKIQKDKNFELIKTNMAYPTVGTLSDRFADYADYLKAKTGTLSNNITLAGYLTDKNGEEHIIAIMVGNFNAKEKDVYALQEKIISAIFKAAN